jgi:hypothetical protein
MENKLPVKRADVLSVFSLVAKDRIHSFGILCRETKSRSPNSSLGYTEDFTGIRVSGIQTFDAFQQLLEIPEREPLEVYLYLKEGSRISINLITHTLVLYKPTDILPLKLLLDTKLVGTDCPITDVRFLY